MFWQLYYEPCADCSLIISLTASGLGVPEPAFRFPFDANCASWIPCCPPASQRPKPRSCVCSSCQSFQPRYPDRIMETFSVIPSPKAGRGTRQLAIAFTGCACRILQAVLQNLCCIVSICHCSGEIIVIGRYRLWISYHDFLQDVHARF